MRYLTIAILALASWLPRSAFALTVEGYVEQVSLINTASGTQGRLHVRLSSSATSSRTLELCTPSTVNPSLSLTNAYYPADENRYNRSVMQTLLTTAKIAKRKVKIITNVHRSGSFCELAQVEYGDFTPPDTIEPDVTWALEFDATNYIEHIRVSQTNVWINLRRFACNGRSHDVSILGDLPSKFSLALLAMTSARKVTVGARLENSACRIESIGLAQ